MARRIADLDDRDFQARIAIRRQLRTAREQLGLSQRELGARLGFDGANVRRLERQGVDQSYAVTVMRWAAGVGQRLVMEPVGFPPPAVIAPSGAGDEDVLRRLAAGRGGVGDGWEVVRTVGRLVGIRVACRVTLPQLAARFGTTPTATSLIETAGSSSALVVLQRHARGIAKCSWRPDAYLHVRLEPAPEPDPV